jgi:hypothetical protein
VPSRFECIGPKSCRPLCLRLSELPREWEPDDEEGLAARRFADSNRAAVLSHDGVDDG